MDRGRGQDPDGARIRLKAVRVPSGWKTTVEDVEAFLVALTRSALASPDDDTEVNEPATPTRTRRRELAKVDAALDAAGI